MCPHFMLHFCSFTLSKASIDSSSLPGTKNYSSTLRVIGHGEYKKNRFCAVSSFSCILKTGPVLSPLSLASSNFYVCREHKTYLSSSFLSLKPSKYIPAGLQGTISHLSSYLKVLMFFQSLCMEAIFTLITHISVPFPAML